MKPAVLFLADGRIEKVAASGQAAEHTDFGDRLLLPGAIDLHVHFREPGHTHKEDFLSGTTAAAFGGVTCVMDMPNTLPATTSAKTLAAKRDLVAGKAVVDYGLYVGATWYTEGLVEALRSAAGVKAYLGATTGDLLFDDPSAFPKVLQHAAAADRPVILHAEAQRILTALKRTEQSPQDHDVARPALAEVEAVYDAMKAVAQVKRPPRIHVAHAAGREAAHAARQAGFSVGACPHHLLLSWEQFHTHPAPGFGKMNPPLRDAKARKALWEEFAAGRIGILESDHAPHTLAEKQDAFHNVPAGVPGVETMVPLMLAKVAAKELELARLVDAVCTRPAALLGCKDRGALAPGMRADFAVYDLNEVEKIVPARLHSKCGWTPFEGMPAVFPTHTYLAGAPVVEEGELVAAPGTGKPFR